MYLLSTRGRSNRLLLYALARLRVCQALGAAPLCVGLPLVGLHVRGAAASSLFFFGFDLQFVKLTFLGLGEDGFDAAPTL